MHLSCSIHACTNILQVGMTTTIRHLSWKFCLSCLAIDMNNICLTELDKSVSM